MRQQAIKTATTAHFNELTEGESERLAVLLETLAQAQQIVGRVLRHGYVSWNPFSTKRGSARNQLEQELGGVLAVITMMEAAGDLDFRAIKKNSMDALDTVRPYLHHQPKRERG